MYRYNELIHPIVLLFLVVLLCVDIIKAFPKLSEQQRRVFEPPVIAVPGRAKVTRLLHGGADDLNNTS